jgi:hypothetical protein
MSRARGGYIGFNRVPAAAALNSAASGVWSLREAEALKRAGTWPLAAPGGVGSGLQLWLDASDASTLYDATSGGSLVAADGGVARWEDKSGNSRHMTQATSGSRPARKTAIQGGLDVLRFDGSNDFMSVASSTATFKFLHDGDSTLFFVLKAGTTANSGHARYAILSSSSGGSVDTGIEINHRDSNPSTENDFFEVFLAKGSNGEWPIYSANNNFFANNTFGVLSLVLDPANATPGSRIAIRRNGGSLSTTNSASGANQTPSSSNASNNLHLGVRGSDQSGNLNGDICEIILYDAALSDTSRAAVETYLLAKWGIT